MCWRNSINITVHTVYTCPHIDNIIFAILIKKINTNQYFIAIIPKQFNNYTYERNDSRI